jgi:hypothetical protein
METVNMPNIRKVFPNAKMEAPQCPSCRDSGCLYLFSVGATNKWHRTLYACPMSTCHASRRRWSPPRIVEEGGEKKRKVDPTPPPIYHGFGRLWNISQVLIIEMLLDGKEPNEDHVRKLAECGVDMEGAISFAAALAPIQPPPPKPARPTDEELELIERPDFA